MKGIKFGSKKRDPKGEGRAVIYKPVQLPVDLIEDFKLYKDAYSRLRESRPDPVLYPVDPCEGDIWEMEYTAWRNGEEYEIMNDMKET